MKRMKLISLLARIGELMLLIAAIILVVRLVPDFRRGSGADRSPESLTGSPAQEMAGRETKENGSVESGSGNRGSVESGSGEETSSQASAEETYGHPSPDREAGALNRRPQQAETAEETEAKEIYVPPTLVLASDLHYLSPKMTDYGQAFEECMASEDGKVMRYQDELLDAFFEEVTDMRPSALILSGDISYGGERVNHEELAKKLKKVQEAGVPVLVIPGNHDVNYSWPAALFGANRENAPTVDADGFYGIYREFGYDQAADRDPASLSYLYKLDERYWMMMLDSAIYDPVNQTGGRIRKETLTWMEEWLERAKEEGVTVIPVAHHNLLKVSTRYPDDCTLYNNEQVIELLESYGLPIYISGHIHLQRIKQHVKGPTSEGEYGIWEIVSASLPIAPCQYGVLNWSEEGSLTYGTRTVDVSGWARRHGRGEEELLDFEGYSSRLLADVVATQVYLAMQSIPDDRKAEMAKLYGELNKVYSGGRVNPVYEVKKTKTYFYWERYMGNDRWFSYLNAILKDSRRDQNSLNLTAGEDFPAVERKETEKGSEESGEEDPRYVYGAG